MKTIYLLFVVVIVGFMASCTYNEYVPEVAPPIDSTDTISFATDIQPIFTAKCIGCHAGSSAPMGLDLEEGVSYDKIVPSHVNLDSPEESLIYTHPSPDGSHYAKYTAAEAQLVLVWIQQGAQNN